MWPKIVKADVWQCSDAEQFLTHKDAVEHERKAGLVALCNDVFGGGRFLDANIEGEDIARLLEEHRHLFMKFL